MYGTLFKPPQGTTLIAFPDLCLFLKSYISKYMTSSEFRVKPPTLELWEGSNTSTHTQEGLRSTAASISPQPGRGEGHDGSLSGSHAGKRW